MLRELDTVLIKLTKGYVCGRKISINLTAIKNTILFSHEAYYAAVFIGPLYVRPKHKGHI